MGCYNTNKINKKLIYKTLLSLIILENIKCEPSIVSSKGGNGILRRNGEKRLLGL